MHTAVAQLLESSACRSATKPALITRERTLTFAELNNLPTCFSAGLAAMAFRQVIAQLCAKEMVGGGSWLTMESSALVRRRSRPLLIPPTNKPLFVTIRHEILLKWGRHSRGGRISPCRLYVDVSAHVTGVLAY